MVPKYEAEGILCGGSNSTVYFKLSLLVLPSLQLICAVSRSFHNSAQHPLSSFSLPAICLHERTQEPLAGF
jgi:hypothetical protein